MVRDKRKFSVIKHMLRRRDVPAARVRRQSDTRIRTLKNSDNIYNIQYIKQKVNQKNRSFTQRNVILKISHDFEKQNALQREKALHGKSERDMIQSCRKSGNRERMRLRSACSAAKGGAKCETNTHH